MRIRQKQPKQRLAQKQNNIATVVLAGGLGNMLFQVAAGFAAAKESGYDFKLYLDHIGGMVHELPTSYRDNIFKKLTTIDTDITLQVLEQSSFRYDPIELPSSLNPNTAIALSGGFQSYKYFQRCASDIKELFAPSLELLMDLGDRYNTDGLVSLHVRRGDYLQLPQHHHNLSIEYYQNAIDYFKGHRFLIFSDDIEWCREQFKGSEFTFAQGNSVVEDLYLMSMCKHNIIANSTFSWWGAWLNTNPEKIVVYPDKWFGPLNSNLRLSDLFPDSWVCLSEDTPVVELNLFDDAFTHLAKPNGRYSSVHNKIASKVKFVKGLTSYNGITLFTDDYLSTTAVSQVTSKYKIGWLLEPRQVQPQRYIDFPHYMNEYDFVLTCDAQLLETYPEKAKFAVVGGTWIQSKDYGIHPKTRSVSMIYSEKQYLEGHKLRHYVAQTISGIDLYGRGTSRPLVNKEDSLLDYRYTIVIENDRTSNYFTEKLIDSLVVGTIPIYWGCPNIGDFFDVRGMIVVNSLEDIKKAVALLTEEEYLSRIDYIKYNYDKAMQYTVTEDWIYKHILKNLTNV